MTCRTPFPQFCLALFLALTPELAQLHSMVNLIELDQAPAQGRVLRNKLMILLCHRLRALIEEVPQFPA